MEDQQLIRRNAVDVYDGIIYIGTWTNDGLRSGRGK